MTRPAKEADWTRAIKLLSAMRYSLSSRKRPSVFPAAPSIPRLPGCASVDEVKAANKMLDVYLREIRDWKAKIACMEKEKSAIVEAK